jgi:RNA polymerase sigma-70 factor, ECF subfamily
MNMDSLFRMPCPACIFDALYERKRAICRKPENCRARRKMRRQPLSLPRAVFGVYYGYRAGLDVAFQVRVVLNERKVEFLKPSVMTNIQPLGTEEIHPDVALVARAKEGDVAAFETLVKQYDRQVFRIAQHITQNREDAEDVVQDAFLKAYEKLNQFQGNSKFYTWLVRIAVNESLMRLRKRRTGRMVSIDEDVETEEGSMPRDLADWSPDPEMMYGQSELADILRKTIQGLPPGFRTVFALRDVEGLSTEETAEALGLSVPAVKSRLLRARLQLRERLSRYFRKNNSDGGEK